MSVFIILMRGIRAVVFVTAHTRYSAILHMRYVLAEFTLAAGGQRIDGAAGLVAIRTFDFAGGIPVQAAGAAVAGDIIAGSGIIIKNSRNGYAVRSAFLPAEINDIAGCLQITNGVEAVDDSVSMGGFEIIIPVTVITYSRAAIHIYVA